jgi:hypothetical protein
MQKHSARVALTGIMVGLLHPATVAAQSAEQLRSNDRKDLSVSFTYAQPTIEQSSTADGTLSGMKYLGQERRFATQAHIWKRLLLALALHRANVKGGQGFSTDPQGVATSLARYQPTASHISHNSLKGTAEHTVPFLHGISVRGIRSGDICGRCGRCRRRTGPFSLPDPVHLALSRAGRICARRVPRLAL